MCSKKGRINYSSHSRNSSCYPDDHGNITQLAGAGTPISFTYDASDQNTSIVQGTNHTDYTKSAGGTILVKKEYVGGTLTKVYKDTGGVELTCNLTTQTSCTTLDKYISLPGGVTLTIENGTPVYSIQNFHGDTAITVAGTGLPNSSVFLYDPFGQVLASSTFGTGLSNLNNASDQSMGWAASPTRKATTMFSIPIIQMGARVYLPTLGRFTSVDPVDGGNDNAYSYVNDPVNNSDYTGQFGWGWVKTALKVVAAVVAVAVVAIAVIAMLPEEAGAATVTAAAALAQRTAPMIQRVAARIAPAASETPPKVQSTTVQEFKSSLSLGQAAHNEFSEIVESQGGVANKAISNGLRPDGRFDATRIVQELKPDNARGISMGTRQLNGYMDTTGYSGELWLYNTNESGQFEFRLGRRF